MSIWRPIDNEHGYFAVGDVAVATHDQPSTSAAMVKEITGGSLAAPVSFTEIWHDRGSGGDHDVRIMRMNPPGGFTCLGHVAVLGYGSYPDASKYRCVKSSYTVTGRYELIWLDRGSGANLDAGLYGNRVSQSNVFAIDANAFTSFATHSLPGGSPRLMDGKQVINHQLVTLTPDTYVFTVFEVTDLDEIWNDGGSGAHRDLAVWRSRGPSNTYSLGDIAVPGGRPAKGYVVKEHKANSLRPAYDFAQVWNDRGSGARWDGAFYLPLCPPGFRALGHVAVRNHHDKPPSNDFRCVSAEYTVQGRWEWVWNDAGSGANRDVSVFKAMSSGNGQGVEAMSTIAHHGGMNVLPYVLNPSITNYVIGKPAKQYILQSIRYLFNDRTIVSTEPDNIARTVVVNEGLTEQQATRELDYSFDETYSWGNTAGLEIGVETTISTGVPLIASGGVTVSTTASYSHEWGGAETKSHSDTISVQTTVQPRSSKAAIIVGNRYTADVPYEATLITVYDDGSRSTNSHFRGVYRGVQVNEIRVTYEADIPLV
ncbi:hypothetical protein BSL78_07782 [Apostichopus japonicus]|uniref:Uncharacterized protein n=1 Tax=Stichopus japonicus TaxID=307972 RepID=A0A2G8L596_STIJA|nr:hypothetical protein BSL78_07782 [Apostichopus japonicus]